MRLGPRAARLLEFLGFDLRPQQKGLTSVNSWWNTLIESFSGAWQTHILPDPSPKSVLAFSAVFACVTGIAADIAKLRIKLTRNDEGIWKEVFTGSPWLPLFKKPNPFQIPIRFTENWILSKLLGGNTYALKQRDGRGVVSALYVLDPSRVTPLVAEDGSVYYQLSADFLAELPEGVTVPASEIIHDRMNCFWHPLVGISPIFACSQAATLGNKISANSTGFFANQSRPGGILTAPGAISDETAARIKLAFETNFGGDNVGRLAVLGDGLKFEPMTMTAEAAKTVEQLKWTVDDVARAFHYPTWKLGAAMPPNTTNPQILTTYYYTDCLQSLIESLEASLDDGLDLPADLGTELDIDNLMRMDTVALYDANSKAVSGGWMSPDEARLRANLGPVPGGDSPYLQQQNYSLAALAKRDATQNPFDAWSPTQGNAAAPKKALDATDLDFLESEFAKELTPA